MERRFNEDLRRHEDSDRAHSAMRHTWINEYLGPKWLDIENKRREDARARRALEDRVKVMEDARLVEDGERRANRRIMRIGFSAIAVLITAFGAAILQRLH